MDVSSGSEFLCPRCKVPLKDVRTSGGVFYGCDVCGGRAVTIELLRKRFTPESINPLWRHAGTWVWIPTFVTNFPPNISGCPRNRMGS